jgi:TRAP-type uncharacterized transport system substrate-binding protein
VQRAGRNHYPYKSPVLVKTELGEMIMILDTPIRGLSNQVTLDTASAVKEFFEMCQTADPTSAYVALHPALQEKVVSVNKSMGLVVKSQHAIVEALEKVSEAQMASAGFQKVIADLERVVSQGESAISDTYSAPEAIVKLWQRNLDLMAQQNSHIDSYVESFRIAFDETCASLLADLATKVSGV